ncbi:ribosome maturation factor RimP [Mechercharimyces sp. CAU 1602]|uniref:ribosome maturation factor RimP n=1 Tax=Mechercharimyces sp. CAU 1602 TaxID=2973933 RepID=UPI002162AD32|nr:ribosome maturation factor RimP [Mechercharimyces sp. CAU 1602]MCS1351281.1 ribosome maturation factor RimP [Mechercharimyces sp. CAU 1602]
MSRKVTEVVEELVLPILEEEEMELVDIEFKKEGKRWFLRLFVDRLEGRIDIDDCSRISERVSEVMDEKDPIQVAYYLEVSSPGAERPLKKERDYERAIGKRVHVSTYEPIDGHKTVEGTLTEVGTEELTVEMDGQLITVPRSKIAKARLAISF